MYTKAIMEIIISVDTRHAAFEKINPREQHLGEVDFNLNPNKPADPSGGHSLKGL